MAEGEVTAVTPRNHPRPIRRHPDPTAPAGPPRATVAPLPGSESAPKRPAESLTLRLRPSPDLTTLSAFIAAVQAAPAITAVEVSEADGELHCHLEVLDTRAALFDLLRITTPRITDLVMDDGGQWTARLTGGRHPLVPSPEDTNLTGEGEAHPLSPPSPAGAAPPSIEDTAHHTGRPWSDQANWEQVGLNLLIADLRRQLQTPRQRIPAPLLWVLRGIWVTAAAGAVIVLTAALWDERNASSGRARTGIPEGTPAAASPTDTVWENIVAPRPPAATQTPSTRNRALPVTPPPSSLATASPDTAPITPTAGETVEPSPTPAPPPAPAPIRYRVQPGDTIFTIARTYGVSMTALIAANNLPASGEIRVGQELVIPLPP